MRHKKIIFIKSYPKVPFKNGAGLRQLEVFSFFQEKGYHCEMIYILPYIQWKYFKKEIENVKNIKIKLKNFPLKSFSFFHNNIRIISYSYGNSQKINPEKFLLILKYLVITKKPDAICAHIIDIMTIASCSESIRKKLILFVQDSEFLKPGKLEQLISYYYPELSGTPYFLDSMKRLFYSKLKGVHLLCVSKNLACKVKKFSNHKPFVLKYYLDKSRVIPGRYKREYIGFINPIIEKGLGLLIRLAIAMPERKFLVMGDAGPTTELLKEIFSILGNVTWKPFHLDIKQFWEKVRIFILPSFWGEGFPRIILEAMINGIPVLATKQKAIEEVLENTGFTFDIGYNLEQTPSKFVKSKNIDIRPWKNKIEELDNLEYYRSVSKKCKIAAEKYLNSIEKNKEELIKWIDEITR